MATLAPSSRCSVFGTATTNRHEPSIASNERTVPHPSTRPVNIMQPPVQGCVR